MTRVVSGTPTTAGTQSVTLIATDPELLSARAAVSFVISASGVTPTPPATLTITSFTCNVTGASASSVTFVVGYSDGTFTPTVLPLFMNGVTANGQLGVRYSLGFDANAAALPIQDAATRSTYFTWNFRSACLTAPAGRQAAEETAGLRISPLGNPVREVLAFEVTGAEGGSLTLLLTDTQGRTLGQQHVEQAGAREQLRFNVGQQPVGILLLRAATPTQSKVIRVLKAE